MRHLVLRKPAKHVDVVAALRHALEGAEGIAFAHQGQGHVQSGILGLLVNHWQSKDATISVHPAVIHHVQGPLGGAPLRTWQEAAQIDAGRKHHDALGVEFREGLHLTGVCFADHGAHRSCMLAAGLCGKPPCAAPHEPMDAGKEARVGRWAAVHQHPWDVIQHACLEQRAQERPFDQHQIRDGDLVPAGKDGPCDGATASPGPSPDLKGLMVHSFDGNGGDARAEKGHLMPAFTKPFDQSALGRCTEVCVEVTDAGPEDPHRGSPT